jgi:hypothetical protein
MQCIEIPALLITFCNADDLKTFRPYFAILYYLWASPVWWGKTITYLPLQFYICFPKHYLQRVDLVNIDYFNVTYIFYAEENYWIILSYHIH